MPRLVNSARNAMKHLSASFALCVVLFAVLSIANAQPIDVEPSTDNPTSFTSSGSVMTLFFIDTACAQLIVNSTLVANFSLCQVVDVSGSPSYIRSDCYTNGTAKVNGYSDAACENLGVDFPAMPSGSCVNVEGMSAGLIQSVNFTCLPPPPPPSSPEAPFAAEPNATIPDAPNAPESSIPQSAPLSPTTVPESTPVSTPVDTVPSPSAASTFTVSKLVVVAMALVAIAYL